MSRENYFIKSPTAIDRLITKIIFRGSNCLRDKRVKIKNIGRAAAKANLFVRNNLNKK